MTTPSAPRISDDELARLKELARAAQEQNQGDWHNADYLGCFINGDDEPVFDQADTAFIVALSPDVALRLIAAARSAPAAGVREAPGAVYAERNLVVQVLAAAMEGLGWHVAWGVDESEPDWPVLYIETEHGQVSWHVPKAERIYEPPDRSTSFGPMVWDGHTDDDKFARLRAALAAEEVR